MSPKEEATPNVGVATVLSAGTRAVGELHAKEDLVLVGSFEGRLLVERALRIMPEAHVDGDVRAERILVLGRTQGKLRASERIEIRAGAIVMGEVMAPQIRVHEGVILNARVHMLGPEAVAAGTAPTHAAVAPAASTLGAVPVARASTVAPARTVVPSMPEPPSVPAPRPAAPPAMGPQATPGAVIAPGWGPGPVEDIGTERPTALAGPSRHYLLPALIRSLGGAPDEDIEHAERATENFLRGLGFELETRAAHPDRTGALRPIFRSAEPLAYATLRERLQRVEQALRAAAADSTDLPLQGTGTAGAREVAVALARLRRAALVVGPVALVRRDENPGDLHLAVRVRRPLPEASAAGSPDPASLLLSLQKMQHELLDELG